MSSATLSKPSPPKPWETTMNAEKTSHSLNATADTTAANLQRPLPTASMTSYNSNAAIYSGVPSYAPPISSYNRPYYGYNSYPTSGYGYRPGYGGYDASAAIMGGHSVDGVGPSSLTRRMETSSREAFRLIDTIVQAVGGFAQMLNWTILCYVFFLYGNDICR